MTSDASDQGVNRTVDLGESAAPDLWQEHAGWWQDEFTDGADAEYEEQILPLAKELLSGHRNVLDLGTGEGQIARALAAQGSEVTGIDPASSQVRVAVERAGGPTYLQGGAQGLPFADDSFDAVLACLVFEHIDPLDSAIAEVARVLKPGGTFAFFLNHPILQAPGSGWIDDHMVEPAEQYWRMGPYLTESMAVEEVQKDVFIPFVHRPLSRYVNALSDAGLALREMHEPAPPPGYLERPGIDARVAAFPRLLVLLTELALTS